MTTAASREPRQTTVEVVIEAITEGVKDGRYAPGQRLVEADLTAELGVSRGPLREALGRLATEGVLEIEPYRGAVVRRLAREDLEDLFAVREVLEGEAARLAAQHVDERDHRARIEAAMDTARDLRREGDIPTYIDENSRFHELIVEMSGSRLLARLVPSLHVHAFRLLFRQLLMNTAAMEQSIDEHDAVANAILAGDGKRAEQAMRRHVRRSREQALRALPEA